MFHKIAHLLGDLEHKAAAEIERLEDSLGYPSEDVRLMADNHTTVRQKVAELNLDPDDTTPRELYHALATRFKQDCLRLEEALGIGQATARQKFHISIELAKLCLADQMVWALKPSRIKQLLRDLPPSRTKKLLGFRSYESMLKRTDAAVVLLVAGLIELPSWQNKYQNRLKKIGPSDWQLCNIHITALPDNAGVKTAVSFDRTAGCIGVSYQTQDTLSLLAQILQAALVMIGQDAMVKLGSLFPALAWWLDNSHLVAWLDSEPVSMNIVDVAANHQDVPYDNRSIKHGGHSLWQKLLKRYRDYGPSAQTSFDLEAIQQLAPQLAIAEDSDVV